MRSFDPTPFYRATVGFDRLLGLLDSLPSSMVDAQSYPPYNIERLGENAFRISMAVAGFSRADLTVEVKDGLLQIRGAKPEAENDRQFLHRGIATRSFERQFQLADYVEVKSADLQDGMLSVDLVREVPERLKPRQITIGGREGEVARLETKSKAAA